MATCISRLIAPRRQASNFKVDHYLRAPSVDIIGSYFPVWMICLTAAVALAFVFRKVLVRSKLEPHLGPPALFYPCLVVLFSCLLWFTFFR